jgi:DtxR family Mn-dependent transcriptional regulator
MVAAAGGVSTEYLESIYNLEMEGGAVIAARLAERFRVSAANVASILQRVEGDGLISRDQNKVIRLTDRGRLHAEAALRRHRLAERFLFQVLGFDWISAHEQAHHLERGLTPEIESRMDELLGHPRSCPHGNPIPGNVNDAAAYLVEMGARRLIDAPSDVPLLVVSVTEVVEDETALLRYAGECGLAPNASVVARRREPGGALAVETARGTVAIGAGLASMIWVRSAGIATGSRPLDSVK